MIAEIGTEGFQPMTSFTEESLFKLQCLIKATEIQHSTQCEYGKRLFLALVTGSAEIFLYYKKDSVSTAVIKRIPWFQGSHKQISALCFNFMGSWLLSTSVDGSVYIIPALYFVDENCEKDRRWTSDDITSFPPISSQSSHSKPTAIVWWQSTIIPAEIGIIGTEYGEIIFINLETGHQTNVTQIKGNIASLHICRDQSNDIVSLLITNQSRRQWRLLLEQRTYSCLQHLENGESYNALRTNDMYDNTRIFASTRSRLQGLKQLSVDKLAILRQKLIETKSQTLGENLQYHGLSLDQSDPFINFTDITSNRYIQNTSINSDSSTEVNQNQITPEAMSKEVFLMSQLDRDGQQLYTCYHSITNQILVYGPNFTTVPLSAHKVFESCRNVLLTQRFFFITDVSQRVMYVISDRLSETRKNDNGKFNPECIVGHFSLVNSKEVIRAVYRTIDCTNSVPTTHSEEIRNKYALPKAVKDIKIELPHVDTCIIVTNHSVYKIVLRKSILSIFMELVLKNNDLEKATKLAIIFGINAQQLLEQAGDILLTNKEFPRAVACYKLSKCRIMKSMLKFASVGYTADLLRCLTHCLASPAISELPVAPRIHLSNLYFLSTNSFYDELLAVNIAGQTCLWEVLHHLATQKGLYGQMLDILMRTIHTSSISNFQPTPYGLLICISEPNLMQAMLVYPELARSHMSFILDNLQDSQIFVLQRLVTLYDPTNPVTRPRVVRCRLRNRTTSHSSQSSQCDSIDLVENDEADTLIEEIIETFLLVLLTLIYKRSILHQESITCNIELLELKKDHKNTNSDADFKRRSLCAGFSHVALIRNGNVYTWGSSVQGCLGTGPSVLRYGSPQAITFFLIMEVEVLSVSCGHCHTLAVTNNGVYAWGSSQFGQLGLGKILQCPTPELITSLAQEVIIDAVAGQYHSVALTADGRVFTWGWGVHGQLGHGNTDKKMTPTLVTSLLGTVIRYISAGHAHTLALSTEGIVYAFGCNIFGQLGVGSNVKSSVPMKVSLSERISLIATGYFHNLAVSYTNKLYIWGASPQVLRLQAQSQKRTRILEQRDLKQFDNIDEFEKITDSTNMNDINEEVLESNAQNKNAQARTCGISTESRKKLDNICLKNVNVGSLEEAQTHLKPTIIDTSLVKGDIIQISTGCHHNALITKDGSLYTWGRNLDGQIGNGSRREVLIPTPLCYNPASIFAQVPPRHNAYKRVEEEQELSGGVKNSSVSERNENVHDESRLVQSESELKEKINPIIKTVGVYCGYDYTIAIQPGGTILAWGNNSRAQLGRLPAKDTRDTDDKLVLIKKRIVRLPHASHVALDMPSQVPNIPAPIISYQSYDVPSLADVIRPLSLIEKSPGELTLNYALEYFCGLYDSSRIIEKCIELGNYQACSKIAMLQHNISDAFLYQLKILHVLSLQSCSKLKSENCEKIDAKSMDESHLKKSSSTRHVEENLIDSVNDCAVKNKMKIPASKSLNSLHTLQQELYTFDCQGGLEEMCKDVKCENAPMGIFEASFDSDSGSDSEEWMENLIFKENQLRKQEKVEISTKDSSGASTPMKDVVDQLSKGNAPFPEKKIARSRQNNITNEAIKVIKFFLNEMENEVDTTRSKILQDALEFWIEHDLPMQSIENIFLEHIQSIFYPLGQEIMDKYLDINKNNTETKNFIAINYFSIKFCLQLCSMLLHHIDQGQPTLEFIKLLSSLTADQFGPPLTGYPGSSGNNTSKEMMEGVISTVSSDIHGSKAFVHIKDPDAVYRFLETEGDTMIFTCGHHFPLALYKTEVIPMMETELLTSESLVLPCTAQYLGKMLSETTKPEILCPLCIPRALETLVKKHDG
ncbi:X-linked retinitis pigmentosa GTPase regulator like protein [Melipona quadrifasciata]|uniref:X-linked retinitis pigmentosa GTPase regulator like protein n=1 Tax=Melipona quadrifasciata TaxID=166423 RepID=A0A0N0BCE6_9HYME|nr:X-linked retinitis pigmentosa GTPase regulator like protein [Melipona quadrifasciata]